METLDFDRQPRAEDTAFLNERLREYNVKCSEEDHHQPFAIYVRDTDGGIAGGLLGGTYWGWLHIDILWLREDLRGQGYGQRLIAAAEAEARARGCRHAHVDTHDFQAPGFYEKLGYTKCYVFEDLPPGHRRIFYKKDL
jgi:GNAT superfamily N-acetyltransferase